MRWWIKVIVALLAPAIVMALILFFRPANRARATAEATRRALREQGFKLEFKDFQRTNSPQVPSSLEVLIKASYACSRLFDMDSPHLLEPVGSNAAMVIWSQEKLASRLTEDHWPQLRPKLEKPRALLDQACAAILAAPIRCELGILRTGELMNTNVGSLKTLSYGLSYRTLLELHDRNRDAAWTNLMALTRLVTAWQIEPVEHSHMVRMALLPTALAATWQAMQTNFWTDSQLAALQREWESLDLFTELPETAALAGANAVMMCRLDREQEPNTTLLRQKASELLRAPQVAWHELASHYREFAYRNCGSYEDENALMLYFRDREGEIRRAISPRSWSEMRYLPGVTNRVPLPSTPRSRSLGNLMSGRAGIASQSLESMLLGRAASSEARRRLLVTALSLERYRLEKGAYPQSLNDLASKLLADSATDFMDGKPLRYQVTGDGHFVLYSVGLDCIDQGGDMRRVKYWHENQEMRTYSLGSEADLVWPRPASLIEVEDQEAKAAARREFEEALAPAAMQGDRKQIEEIIRKYLREFEEKLREATGSPPPVVAPTNREMPSNPTGH
jgi:hypothetical protein